MKIVAITERVARERRQHEQADLLAAGTLTACAWHLTMVAAYFNESGRVDLAVGLRATADAISSVAEVVKPTIPGEGIQPLHPRDVG